MSQTVGKAVNREPAGTASAAETAARPVPVRRRAPRVLAGRHHRRPPPSTAGDDHGSATDAKQESTGKRKTDSGPRRYAGLEAAGIPVPGDSSQRTTAFPVDTHKDGTRTLSENADGITLHNGSGPIDTALETVDALLDPNGSDDEWRNNVLALLGDDGAGVKPSGLRRAALVVDPAPLPRRIRTLGPIR